MSIDIGCWYIRNWYAKTLANGIPKPWKGPWFAPEHKAHQDADPQHVARRGCGTLAPIGEGCV